MQKNQLPKSVKLWLSTRQAGSLLSGQRSWSVTLQSRLFRLTGIRVTREEVKNFHSDLRRLFLPFSGGIFYRGVFENDSLYLQLKNSAGHFITTTRFFSCSTSEQIARLFGQRIVLVFQGLTGGNFDLSQVSREKEIILDRGVSLRLERITREQFEGQEFEYFYLMEFHSSKK